MLSTSKLFYNRATTATDPYFKYVPLLLETTSTNGQQNNTFLDSSTNNFTITRNGTPTQGSVTPYWPDGYWSNYFDGGANYLSPPSNAAFAFGTGDFTLECWIYTIAASDVGIYEGRASGSGTAGFTLGAFSSSVIRVYTGTSAIISSSGTSYLNQWTHVAVVRASGTTTLYINGTSVGTSASMGNLTDTTPVIGAGRYTGTTTPSAFFNGYISNFRMVKGTAVYTGNFTPSANPLTAITNTSLLTCQSNRFRDNSTNNFTLTTFGTPRVQAFQPFSPPASYTAAAYGGSGYFNSTTDYLSAATDVAFNLGTTFTIEFWVYRTNTNAQRVLSRQDGTTPFNGYNISYGETAGSWIFDASGSAITFSDSFINTWTHYAWVVNGTSGVVYRNGVSVGTATQTAQTPTSNTTLLIGARNGPTNYFSGYISNLRILKGTAVYTGAFTPPTLAPLTTAGSTSAASYSSTTNVNTSFGASATSLLTNFTNAAIYDAAVQNNAITVGSAQASTTVAKWSPTSMKFNGTTDYLTMQGSQALALGSSDFTIEFWVYVTAATTNIFFDFRPSTTNGVYPYLYANSDNLLRYYVSSADRIVAGSAFTLNAWNYVALTRASGVTKLYLNGTQQGSNYTDTNVYLCGAGRPAIAGFGYTAGLYLLSGYIQDFRVTNGVARTITTPTAAFPTR